MESRGVYHQGTESPIFLQRALFLFPIHSKTFFVREMGRRGEIPFFALHCNGTRESSLGRGGGEEEETKRNEEWSLSLFASISLFCLLSFFSPSLFSWAGVRYKTRDKKARIVIFSALVLLLEQTTQAKDLMDSFICRTCRKNTTLYLVV